MMKNLPFKDKKNPQERSVAEKCLNFPFTKEEAEENEDWILEFGIETKKKKGSLNFLGV